MVSPLALIGSMIRKDARVYIRDRVFLFLTVLGLVFFVLIYWFSPSDVDETITLVISPSLETMIGEADEVLGQYGVAIDAEFDPHELEQQGLKFIELTDETEVRRVIEGSLQVYDTDKGFVVRAMSEEQPEGARVRPDVGISFPSSFIVDVASGQKPTVTVFSDAAVPVEIEQAMESFVRELAYELAGEELPVVIGDEEMIILGQDRVGEQVSLQDRLRPMLVFFVFLTETLSMGSLISTEIARKTVTALMVTPLKIIHFLTAKSVFGIGLGLIQALIILALVGAFTAANWSLLLVTALMGALLFTGVAMLIGTAGRDFMGQLMFGTLFTVPLMIPAFSVLFPGSAATWVQFIPSYPIIELLVDITIYNATWSDAVPRLGFALLWVIVIYGLGLFVLKRKVESL